MDGYRNMPAEESPSSEGYLLALDLLRRCATPDGFLASPSTTSNYARVWSRDGVIQLLAALLSDREELVAAGRATLETLAAHRGPHGEVPSNVEKASHRVSYGGTAGRVDADLWFLIGCGEYWAATGDDDFLEAMRPAIDEVLFLVGAWEFNGRGLIYVPVTGDWADEYLQHGYVLYDQLLYLQALRSVCAVRAHLDGTSDHELEARTQRLRHLIQSNYWFDGEGEAHGDIYHPTLFTKGLDAAPLREGEYWMPYFGPAGYGFRFDAMANVLASLLDVASDDQRSAVDSYMRELLDEELPIVPAFHPVITPLDEAWEELQMTFQYDFRNRPHEYHNGGRWPMIGGFHCAERAKAGDIEQASRLLEGIHKANALPVGDVPSWGFAEFVNGVKLEAGGTVNQGWSAAGAVLGEHALLGEFPFRISDSAQKIVETHEATGV